MKSTANKCSQFPHTPTPITSDNLPPIQLIHHPYHKRQSPSYSANPPTTYHKRQSPSYSANPQPPGKRNTDFLPHSQSGTCPHCFVHFAKLPRHVSAVHYKERPFQCFYCPKSFTQSGHRLSHMRNKHDYKNVGVPKY